MEVQLGAINVIKIFQAFCPSCIFMIFGGDFSHLNVSDHSRYQYHTKITAATAASLESSHYRFTCVRIYSEANLLVDTDDLLVLCQPGKRKRCLFICSNSQLMDARTEVAHLLHQKGGC